MKKEFNKISHAERFSGPQGFSISTALSFLRLRSRITTFRNDSVKKGKAAVLGFTLIELLVVVLIIGILAAVALPQYQLSVNKARASKHLAMLDSLYKAQVTYIMAVGTYSSDFNEISVEMPEGCDAQTSAPYVLRYPNGVEYHLIMLSPNFVAVVDKHLGITFMRALPTSILANATNGQVICGAGESANTHRLCKALTGQKSATGGSGFWYHFK